MKLESKFLIFITSIILSACGDSSSSVVLENNSTNDNNTTDNISNSTKDKYISETIVHNGITYKTIKSPYTNRIWLDRNLGASRACRHYNDIACFGDYYQYGRNRDGHQKPDSEITNEQATSLSNSGSKFIIADDNNRRDWANSIDPDGKERSKLILSSDGTFVCPKNFRIPMLGELKAEVSKDNGKFFDFLKLPIAGHRLGSTGELVISESGYLRFSYNNDTYPSYFFYTIDGESGRGYSGSRSTGVAIRCIKVEE